MLSVYLKETYIGNDLRTYPYRYEQYWIKHNVECKPETSLLKKT